MRLGILVFALLALSLGSTQAKAASCSHFAVIKSYDADAKTVEISYEKGSLSKYFPRPEGASQERSMIPKKCRGKVKKTTTLKVKPTGGKMTVTQLRSNFEGKMLNDTEDPDWLPARLKKMHPSASPRSTFRSPRKSWPRSSGRKRKPRTSSLQLRKDLDQPNRLRRSK
jgi:hypothetical protein